MFVVCNEKNWCHSFRLLNIGCSSLLYYCTPILMLVIIAYLVYGLMLVMEYTLQLLSHDLTYTFYSCVRRLYGLFSQHLKTAFGQFKFNLTYTETSVYCSGMCCFSTSIVHYFWSWKLCLTSNAIYIRCIVFWSVFLMLFIHSGFLALTYNILGT